MKGYVARKGNRYYAVIYEGTDPLTGRDRRRWYPAGTDKEAAEALASDLADRHRRGGHERSSLTVAVYLTQRWLPAKKLALRPSTWDAYRRIIDLHVIPRIGRIPLRHLRPDHLERLYADLLDDRTRRRHRRAQQQDRGRDPHDPAPSARRRRPPRLDPVQPGRPSPTPRSGGHCRATPRAVWTAQQLAAFLTSTTRPPLPRRALGHRQHRNATRRDPRAPLG